MTPKKIPMRMCLGCNEQKPKREMTRVVHQPDGSVCLDKKGKMAGRGAYICPAAECLRKARKARRLEKAFSCQIEDAVYAALEAQLSVQEETP